MVAEYAPGIREAVTFDEECNSFECLTGAAIMARAYRNGQAAEDFRSALISSKPYPDELASLARRTERSLHDVVESYNALSACGDRTGSMFECGDELDGYENAFTETLPQALNAWEPYL